VKEELEDGGPKLGGRMSLCKRADIGQAGYTDCSTGYCIETGAVLDIKGSSGAATSSCNGACRQRNFIGPCTGSVHLAIGNCI